MFTLEIKDDPLQSVDTIEQMNLFQLLSKQPFSKTLMADDCEVRSSVVDQTEQWPPSVQCTGLSGSQPSHCAMLQIY